MNKIYDLIAVINITLSNFFFKYGQILIIILCAFIACLLAVMLYRAHKCDVRPKGRYKYPAPDANLSKSAAESLCRAVSFETVAGSDSQLCEFRKYLKDRYPLIYSTMEVDEINGGSLLFRWRGKDSAACPILLAGHMDVVPAEGKWTCPPFLGVIKDDKVYGRGAIDCKNVVISILEAAEKLLSESFLPERDIYFAFGHDEETGGKEGAAVISRLLEKRGIHPEIVLDEGGCIINGYMGSRSAAACVYVSEKARYAVEITAHGQSGHSSTPGKHTAIGILSEAICRIEASPFKKKMSPLVCEYFKRSAGFMPFFKRVLCANLPFTKYLAIASLSKDAANAAMMHTTAAATVISGGKIKNALPESAVVNFDIRLLPGQSKSDLLKYFDRLLSDLPCSVEITEQGAACAVSDYNCKSFSVLCELIKERFGDIPVIPAVMNGAADAKYYEKICRRVYRFMPFVLTPQQLGAMHASDEHIPINSLGAGVEFYKAFMRNFGSNSYDEI